MRKVGKLGNGVERPRGLKFKVRALDAMIAMISFLLMRPRPLLSIIGLPPAEPPRPHQQRLSLTAGAHESLLDYRYRDFRQIFK